MTTKLEQDLAALSERAELARQANARAEIARAQAEGQRQAALQSLAAEFGVSSEDEAVRLLAQLETEASAEASKVSAALTAAGG